MTQPRIIFAGTPEFAAKHLDAMIQHGFTPVAVYTQPDRPAGRGRQLQASPVKQLAVAHDIPCYQPLSLKDTENQDEFARLQPDLMIVVAYGLILPQAILDIPRLGCINVHASLLPRWRGAAPIQRAIEAGDQDTGVTIMQMDAGLDTGDMLHKKIVPIAPTDTSASLHDKLAASGGQALIEVLPDILTGNTQPEVQDEQLVTYANKMTKEEGLINWSDNAATIDQRIRAFTPWPGAQAELNDLRVKISARLSDGNDSAVAPGTIIQHVDSGVLVQCGQGVLVVEKIQFPGKRMTDVSALLNSHQDSLAVGSQFS